MIDVSAPGKLMLFGEHAVLYGKHCIVTAVNKRTRASFKRAKNIVINAKDFNISNFTIRNFDAIPKPLRFVSSAIEQFHEKYKIKSGFSLSTYGDLKSHFGLGSSAAIIVCIIKGLARLFRVYLQKMDIFNISHKIVRLIQGVGSGFDVAAATYGGTLKFANGGKTLEKIKIDNLPLIVGYSGVKADTSAIIRSVTARYKKYPQYHNSIFNSIDRISIKASNEVKDENWKRVGDLMNKNQRLLRKLDVSSPRLEKLISAARHSGAYGAKLSGAGIGDCMIALASDSKREDVEHAIEKAGGTVLDLKTNASGVRAS